MSVNFTITNNSKETTPGVQPTIKIVGTVQHDLTPVLVVLETGQSYTSPGGVQGTWDVSSIETGEPVLLFNVVNSPVGSFRVDYNSDFVPGIYDVPLLFNVPRGD